MKILNIYLIGHKGAGKHLFLKFQGFDAKIEEQELIKIITPKNPYMGYKYNLYIISGAHPQPHEAVASYCDAILFLVNPSISNACKNFKETVSKIAEKYKHAVLAIMVLSKYEDARDCSQEYLENILGNEKIIANVSVEQNIPLYTIELYKEDIELLESNDPDPEKNLKLRNKVNMPFYEVINACIKKRSL